MKANNEFEFMGKCLYVPEIKALVIGDLHLGYEEFLNRSGILISRQMFGEILKEIGEVIDKILEKGLGIEKIILLGDVKHSFSKNLRQEWNDVLEFFDFLSVEKGVEKIIVTRGNHDNYLKTIAGKRKVEVLDYFIDREYAFFHGDKEFVEIYDKNIKYFIVGHGHPAIKIKEGIKVEKFKCFLIGDIDKKKIVILPSFIEYNEGSDPRENDLNMFKEFNYDKFEVLIVSDNLEVLNFGKIKNLA